MVTCICELHAQFADLSHGLEANAIFVAEGRGAALELTRAHGLEKHHKVA